MMHFGNFFEAFVADVLGVEQSAEPLAMQLFRGNPKALFCALKLAWQDWKYPEEGHTFSAWPANPVRYLDCSIMADWLLQHQPGWEDVMRSAARQAVFERFYRRGIERWRAQTMQELRNCDEVFAYLYERALAAQEQSEREFLAHNGEKWRNKYAYLLGELELLDQAPRCYTNLPALAVRGWD